MQLNLDHIPGWFLETGLGKQMIKEKTQALLERRRTLVAEIADLRAKELKEGKLADEACVKAKAVWEDAKAKLTQAEQEYTRTLGARSAVSSRIDHQVSQREAELHRTASPLIGDFLRELARREDRIRAGVYTATLDSKRNLVTDKVQRIFTTNITSTREALAACKAAREEAEKLRLQGLSEAELVVRLTSLRESIPEVVMTVVQEAA